MLTLRATVPMVEMNIAEKGSPTLFLTLTGITNDSDFCSKNPADQLKLH